MKKKFCSLLWVLLFTINFYSQNLAPGDDITKGVLAGVIFNLVYEDDTNPNHYEANEFPNPFIDLQENSTLFKQLRILSHLTYGDGIGLFSYTYEPSYTFDIDKPLTKIETLIAVMEGWNIEPDYSGSVPYNDIDPDDFIFGYVNKAYDEGLIDGGSNFHPYSIFTEGETLELLNEVLNSSYHPVNENLYSLNNYFIPGIYFPDNLTNSRSVNQGVLNHYAKNSFVIPDIKMNLDFSHFYSTAMVEMPESFYPIKPLGRGWSHTYNSYITREEDVIDSDDYYFITWPDGNVHIFNEDEGSNGEYISKGVYDEFDELSNGDIRITKKDQTRYYFEQLDNDLDVWYLVEIRDSNGNSIFIEYESAEAQNYERIEYVEAPSGKRLLFEYLNGTDLIEKIEDPIGREIFFEYSGLNGGWVYRYPILVTFEDAKENMTSYSYMIDSPYNIHLLNRIELPRGNLITADYDNNGKLQEYRINNDDPIDIDVDFDYNNGEKRVDISSPVNGGGQFEETYKFNSNGLVTDYNSDTDELEITYPSSGINVMLPTDTNLNGVHIEYKYDNNGNVTEINKENGDVVEEFNYDSDNNLTRYTNPNGNDTFFDYDNDENLTGIHDPLGNTITFQYDSHGQLLSQTNQEGITTTYSYENDGAVSSILRPENIQSHFFYDDINRLLVQDHNGLVSTQSYDQNDNIVIHVNSMNIPTSFTYDENDNLSSITNGNNITTSFTYDNEDRVIREQFGNLIKEYEYSDEGFLEQYTKPSGSQITYEYDDEGRLEETGTITDMDYNNRNLIERIATNDIRYNFEYDNLNRLEEVINDGSGETVTYDYDDAGNITRIYYPNLDFHVRYNYDPKNRLEQVRYSLNGNTQTIAEYSYRADDLISEINYGNGITTQYSYDNAGRKIGTVHLDTNGNIIYSENIDLDNRGNVLNATTQYLEIDGPLGNFVPSIETQNFTYDQNNHIQGSGYNVNSDGNTISGSGDIYAYDIEDQLVHRTTPEDQFAYEYDPYGNRVKRENITQGYSNIYVWDIINKNIIQKGDPSTSETTNIVYGIGLEAKVYSNGTIWYYHGDTRGNVVQVTNSDGLIIRDYNYDDFGLVQRVNVGYNPDLNEFTFLGKHGIIEDDRDQSLYYIRARYYDAKIGRFFTEDPIWSSNLYPYADNNPISRIDPSGKIDNPLNNPFTRFYVPDVVNVGLGFNGIAGIGAGQSFELNFITRGQDASFIPVLTSTTTSGVGFNVDAGINFGGKYYTGNISKLERNLLETNINNGDFDLSYYFGAAAIGKIGLEPNHSNNFDFIGLNGSIGFGAPAGLFPFNYAAKVSNSFILNK